MRNQAVITFCEKDMRWVIAAEGIEKKVSDKVKGW